MNYTLYFLVTVFLSFGLVYPLTRVRRQGFTFSDEDNDNRSPSFSNGRRPSNGGRFQFDNDRPSSNNGQFQFDNGGLQQRSTSTTAAPAASGSTTTTATPAFRRCMSSCLTTVEYNPVCGSDGTTYPNEGRMRCANRCGVRVVKVFGGTCQPL